ncbi:DNA (cytosine-5)-methyltransferase-like protein 1 [Sarcoptes scabiei]|uniref:DNA (cytosine-5-)-methyltransferase n=1 Tax=Sarcoptes scabiei TaxID=52283 RepID=A0A132ABZ7_SARSC|nr:DNA (cytosine-5)-methyltransferase-like protein 1 [Sarcoptes scabiei]
MVIDALFLRPENVFVSNYNFMEFDPNLLFWTDRTHQLNQLCILRKCTVIFASTSPCASIDFEPEIFYFNSGFNHIKREFFQCSDGIRSKFSIQNDCYSKINPKLTILDLFAGCGGLSWGFHLMAKKHFAIENDRTAAQSFKTNYPKSIVLNADANLILNLLVEKNRDPFLSRNIPVLGSVDLIIGGPPCQGFTDMNRFYQSESSSLKRSTINCYLNFIELYRPKFFLFENVPSLISYARSSIIKIFCSFFIHIGYQIRIAVLQAANYRLPQNRRRLFIIGSENSYQLPKFPDPITSIKSKNLSFQIDGKRFNPIDSSKTSMRMIAIHDAIGDLIELGESDYHLDQLRPYKIDYNDKISYFQKILRKPDCQTVEYHHCKKISELNMKRIEMIPQEFNSDWRDLPNIECILSNGKTTDKLDYIRKSVRKSSHSKVGRKKQNTLIPWCLANTADRNNHWPGLYGRLSKNDVFPTIVSNPDPISSQGKVIHPEQNRIISIREMARSQGFPDHFVLYGSETEKFSQIGNAVPPILSFHLAREFYTIIDNQQ